MSAILYTHRHHFVRVGHLFAIAAMLSSAVETVTVARSVRADGLADQVHSLRLVPADAAVYSASLRLKEQWDNFIGSKAYARLMEIPAIQTVKMLIGYQLQASPEPSIAAVREYFDSPAGKESLAVIGEMFSDEVFGYGSADLAELLDLTLKISSVNQSTQVDMSIGGSAEPEAVARRIREILNNHKDQLKMPDAVAGFRIRDRQQAVKQLAVVEAGLKRLLTDSAPELAARLKREQIAGHEYLTLRINGSLLPWDRIRAQASDVSAEEFDKWRTLISAKTMVAAIGVFDEFVLLSFGDSTEHLEKLGQGPLLVDGAAMARVTKHSDQRIASVSYASGAFMKKANSPRRSLDDAVNSLSQLLKATPIIEEAQRTKLVEDVRGLADVLLKFMPDPGDVSAVSYLTPRGYEAFRYNFGAMPGVDSSRPLAIVNHVGGNPMFFVAAHGTDNSADLRAALAAVARLAGDVEKIAETQTPPAEWAEYQKYRGPAIELLERLERVAREKIIPALRANEQAVVIDVASKSVQWFAPMPKSPEPLPMLELGIACQVSDSRLLRQGVSETVAVIDDALKLLHDIHPAEIPEVKLPMPQEKLLSDGMIAMYPFPAEWGVDSQLALNAGLTDDTAAVSVLPAFTEQLLKTTPLAIDTTVDMKRPAGMVTHFEFAKLVKALRPWIDYSVGLATGQIASDEAFADPSDQQSALMQAGLVLPQVHQFLDVLTVFHSYSSVTYRDDNAWVTHAEMRLKDLE